MVTVYLSFFSIVQFIDHYYSLLESVNLLPWVGVPVMDKKRIKNQCNLLQDHQFSESLYFK